MRFNSTRNSRANSYIRAGEISGRQSAGIFNSIKEAAPDFTGIIKTKQEADSKKKRQQMTSTGQIGKSLNQARATYAKQKYATDLNDLRKGAYQQQQFAGFLGALGKDVLGSIAKRVVPKPTRPKPVEYDFSSIRGNIQRNLDETDALLDGFGGQDGPALIYQDESGKWIDPMGDFTPPTVQSLQTEGAAGVSTPQQTGGVTEQVAPAQPVSFTPVSATGVQRPMNPMVQSILPGESGGHGLYNAYNLGGNSAFDPIGSGNSAVNSPFGKPVTELTLDEIHALHDSGQAHAMGGYQFTGAGGLREAQAGLGLPGSTVFTPPVQDALANEYGYQTLEAGRSLYSAWPSLQNADPIMVEKLRRGWLQKKPCPK